MFCIHSLVLSTILKVKLPTEIVIEVLPNNPTAIFSSSNFAIKVAKKIAKFYKNPIDSGRKMREFKGIIIRKTLNNENGVNLFLIEHKKIFDINNSPLCYQQHYTLSLKL